jgi:hypothetical protein
MTKRKNPHNIKVELSRLGTTSSSENMGQNKKKQEKTKHLLTGRFMEITDFKSSHAVLNATLKPCH